MIEKYGYVAPLYDPDSEDILTPEPSFWERCAHHLRLCWQSVCNLFARIRQ
jgi:hypothetical protein